LRIVDLGLLIEDWMKRILILDERMLLGEEQGGGQRRVRL
jgi:hypothetical protein